MYTKLVALTVDSLKLIRGCVKLLKTKNSTAYSPVLIQFIIFTDKFFFRYKRENAIVITHCLMQYTFTGWYDIVLFGKLT